jgi:DNA repair protein RecO (recombination protein O)
LQPFTRVKVQVAHGRDLWIITQAETVEAYLPLREDLLRVAYATYVIELIDRFTYDEGASPMLYQLLVDTLERVSSLSDPFIAVRYYEIHLLDLVGFRPELFHCVECGAAVQAEDQYFDALMGGMICPGCAGRFPAALPVSVGTLKFLRHLQRSTFKIAARANPSGTERAEMESLLNHFITYLLERRMNSPHFLHEVRHDRYRAGQKPAED